MRPRILILILFGNMAMSYAEAKENCVKAIDAVPKYEASKKMFGEIFNFKKKYSHCMDGGIAESISTIIVDSLDKNWNQLRDIEKLNKQDSGFKKFILINIEPKVTGQEFEVGQIMQKAQNSCPQGMKAFCQELVKACEQSLKPESAGTY